MGSDYHSLIRIYLEDSPKLIQQMQAALDNRDSVALGGTVAYPEILQRQPGRGETVEDRHGHREKRAHRRHLELPARETPALLVSEYEKVKAALAEIIA